MHTFQALVVETFHENLPVPGVKADKCLELAERGSAGPWVLAQQSSTCPTLLWSLRQHRLLLLRVLLASNLGPHDCFDSFLVQGVDLCSPPQPQVHSHSQHQHGCAELQDSEPSAAGAAHCQQSQYMSLLHTYLLQSFCGLPYCTEGHLQLQDSVLRTAPGIAEQRVLHLFAAFEL
jgi:hypothetical protein